MFLIPILHQTTTFPLSASIVRSCFSFQFYIKPQQAPSNNFIVKRCFSFQFYIKPQLDICSNMYRTVVSHSNSTSNHNKRLSASDFNMVVSHSNSTSNHNIIGVAAVRPKVVSHSNSTSNHNISLEEARLELLFLIPILHQTTTYERSGKRCALLFLIPILHQTTTAMQTSTSSRCCFSFQFYIKPQL